MELMTVRYRDQKLWVTGDITGTQEFYLPDANRTQIEEFLTRQVVRLAETLSLERPWREVIK